MAGKGAKIEVFDSVDSGAVRIGEVPGLASLTL
jgi:hypothetical protein